METLCTSDRIEKALINAIALTFADMSFLDVQPASDSGELEDGQLLHITFVAPISGGMILMLPLELKRQIVENVHAASWEDLTTAQIDDCLLELLNVLAGNFLQILFGEETKINLSFPEVLFERSEVNHCERYSDYYFSAEGTLLVVSVYAHETGE
ncbi:chemotaxis protein CheX [Sediminispirochaeta bajacaliforniensis]|uniref:chemotaxis protein CheX n=1 Tax=Sediminispirochaeta bajacaliforniensis TaxID=148 RepID=UPI0003783D45|nr:chemotaxis protein CheX [Sediminispirochaeta bajacaliforniensis]